MAEENESFDHKGKKAEHMTRRYKAHGSFERLGEEFGMSKSNAHRIVQGHNQKQEEAENE